MTTRLLVRYAVLWLLLSAAAVHGEEPTRQSVVAFAAECKRLDVQMDLVDRFGTDFSGLDLRGVDFRAASVTLRGKFRPDLRTNLRGATFTNCNLRSARFDYAMIDGADFTGADLTDANFQFASLRNATLRNVTVTGTRFFYGNLAEAKLPGLDLSRSDITGASFPGADLSGCRLAGAIFHFTWQVDWQKADLSDADLRGLTFSHSNFRDANLRSADLSGCDLKHSDFTGADLQDANLTKAQVGAAVFDNVRGMSDAEMRKVTNAAWRFTLKSRAVAFLDSFAFPVALLLAIPLVVAATRSATQRWARRPSDAHPRFQFSLTLILFLTAVTGGFLGVALLSPTGTYSFAMVCAFYMMVAEIARSRVSRKSALGLLGTALVYVVLNVAVYIAIIEIDPVSLFNPAFDIGVIFVGPLLAIVGAAVFAITNWHANKGFPGLALAGFGIWMAGVGCANLWAIGTASASV